MHVSCAPWRMCSTAFTVTGMALLSLRGAFATRQSDPKHVRWQIAASQTLLAMTMDGASRFPVAVKRSIVFGNDRASGLVLIEA
jgi:hypothetical protein